MIDLWRYCQDDTRFWVWRMDKEMLERNNMHPEPWIRCTKCQQNEYVVAEKYESRMDCHDPTYETKYIVHCLWCGEELGGHT